VTTDVQPTFATIAEAEQALKDAGFQRDKARAMWYNLQTRASAKVAGLFLRFYIKPA